MAKSTRVSASVLMTTLILGCGTDGTKKSETGGGSTETNGQAAVDQDTSLLLDDDQLVAEHVANNTEDAITDMLEGSESKDSGSGGFALTGDDKVARVERYRTCKISDDQKNAIVSVKRSVDRERTFSRLNRSGSSVLKLLMEKTRTWSKEGGSIACAADGKHADIDRANLQGVTLVATFNRQHLQSSAFENLKKGTSRKQSRKSTATGKKTMKWTAVKTEGANIILTKQVESESTRSFESINKKGDTKSFTTTVKTDTSLPLVIQVERDKVTDKIVSHTIVSGKKVAVQKSGGRIETVFTSVKYLPNDGCYATSGKIEGSIFAKDATAPSTTYVVEFSGDTKNIVMTKADGSKSEVEYVADGCDLEAQELEDTSGVPVEKSSADQVNLQI
jgi:hypothetical protein